MESNGGTRHEYEIRISKRAKYLRLQINELQQVTVVVPLGVSRHQINQFIDSKREWIALTQKKFASHTREQKPLQFSIPTTLELQAVNKTLTVCPIAVSTHVSSIKILDDNIVLVSYPPDEMQFAINLLKKLVKRLAQVHLTELVAKLSEKHQLHPERVIIRTQKSKWGSYSTTGTLSLNSKLMFLPAEFVELIVLHELAHIKHLNHSPQFWEFLTYLLPNARSLNRNLKHVSSLVPVWMHT